MDEQVAVAGESQIVEVVTRQQEWVSMQQMKQLVRICCLEVMGAAPAQLEHYRQEVRELQSLVADFRREVSELRDLKVNSSSDDGLTLDEHTHVEPSASHAPHDGASLLTHGLGAMPPSQSPNGAASSAILPGLATGGGVPYVPLRRLYVELDGAPIQSWYENRPMPPVTVKLMDDQSPPSVVAGVANIRLRVSLCNGRGMPEERTANGAQDLLVGEREAPIVDGFATFQNLRVMEISQKHYGSFQLSICAVGCPEGYAVQPLRTKQFVVQVGRMWSKRRKSEDEISPDDPISQIPGVGKQYVSRLQVQGIVQIRQFAQLCSTDAGKQMLQRMFKGDKLKNSLNDSKFNSMVEQANKVMLHAASGGHGASESQGSGDRFGAEFSAALFGGGAYGGADGGGAAKRARAPDERSTAHTELRAHSGVFPPPLDAIDQALEHAVLGTACAPSGAHAFAPTGLGTPLKSETDSGSRSHGHSEHSPTYGGHGGGQYASGAATPLGCGGLSDGVVGARAAPPAGGAAPLAAGGVMGDQLSMDEIMTLFAEDVPQHELMWRSAGGAFGGGSAGGGASAHSLNARRAVGARAPAHAASKGAASLATPAPSTRPVHVAGPSPLREVSANQVAGDAVGGVDRSDGGDGDDGDNDGGVGGDDGDDGGNDGDRQPVYRACRQRAHGAGPRDSGGAQLRAAAVGFGSSYGFGGQQASPRGPPPLAPPVGGTAHTGRVERGAPFSLLSREQLLAAACLAHDGCASHAGPAIGNASSALAAAQRGAAHVPRPMQLSPGSRGVGADGARDDMRAPAHPLQRLASCEALELEASDELAISRALAQHGGGACGAVIGAQLQHVLAPRAPHEIDEAARERTRGALGMLSGCSRDAPVAGGTLGMLPSRTMADEAEAGAAHRRPSASPAQRPSLSGAGVGVAALALATLKDVHMAEPSPGAQRGMNALHQLLHALPTIDGTERDAALSGGAPAPALPAARCGAATRAKRPPFAAMSDAHAAAWSGDQRALLRALRAEGSAGAAAGARERSGCTVLDAAALGGDADCVQVMLRHQQQQLQRQMAAADGDGGAGAPGSRVGADGGVGTNALLALSPLHVCIASGKRTVHAVRALLAGGLSPNARGAHGLTPLHVCAHVGDVPIATALLDAGADVCAAESRHQLRPAHLAALGGHAGLLEMLLQHGDANPPSPLPQPAEPTVQGARPLSLLLCAAISSSNECVRLALATRPARGNAAELRAALLACALCGASGCLRLLLTEAVASPHVRAGPAGGAEPAMVDAADDDGTTLLILSTLYLHEPCVSLLLEHGAAVNATAAKRWSALHFAAAAGDEAEAIAMRLLAAGADPALETSDGKTAAQIAHSLGHEAMHRTLSRSAPPLNDSARPPRGPPFPH